MGQKQKIADEDGDNSDGGGKDERAAARWQQSEIK